MCSSFYSRPIFVLTELRKDPDKLKVNNSVTTPLLFALNSLPDCVQICSRLCPDLMEICNRRIPRNNYAWLNIIPAFIAIANGCRIGEILALNWSNVLPNGMAFVSGEKGSNARMIFTGLLPSQVVFGKAKAGNTKVFPQSYQQVYHYAVMAGLSKKLSNRKNRSVTHTGRYNIVSSAANSLGLQAAKEIIGHKSKKSTLCYLGNANRSLKNNGKH